MIGSQMNLFIRLVIYIPVYLIISLDHSHEIAPSLTNPVTNTLPPQYTGEVDSVIRIL